MCSWCLGWCPCSTGRAAGAGGVSPSGGSERGNTRPALAPSSIPASCSSCAVHQLLSCSAQPSSRLTERERHRQRMTRRGGARKGAPLQRARAGAHRLRVQLATASSQIENKVGGHGIPGLGARAKSGEQDKTEKGAEEKGVGEQICYIRSL